MMALAAANSPRIHEINPSLPSGIQFPGGATFPGGIAIGVVATVKEEEKKDSFFLRFCDQTELISSVQTDRECEGF